MILGNKTELTNAAIFRPDLSEYYEDRQDERPDYLLTCYTYVIGMECGHCCTLWDADFLMPLNSCTCRCLVEDYTYQNVMRRCVQAKIDRYIEDGLTGGNGVRDLENLLDWIEEGGDSE